MQKIMSLHNNVMQRHKQHPEWICSLYNLLMNNVDWKELDELVGIPTAKIYALWPKVELKKNTQNKQHII